MRDSSFFHALLTALLILFCASLLSCATAPRKLCGPSYPHGNYQKSDVANVAFFTEDSEPASLLQALDQSIAFYRKTPAFCFTVNGVPYSSAEMTAGLLLFKDIVTANASAKEKRQRLLQDFQFVSLGKTAKEKSVVFTGYYGVTLNGSLARDSLNKYPLYSPPPEIGDDASENPSRRAIDVEGKLKNRGLEIAWVSDPVALFALHIQGTGKIVLQNGSTVRVRFAASNGKPFRSVANHLFAAGLIPNRTNAAVGKYLRGNLAKVAEILSYNERYVFFRLGEGKATGALGMPLTAGRSVAVDFSLFPKGSLAFIETALPVLDSAGRYAGKRKTARFVFCQDAGTAIKGPRRVDFFFGALPEAEALANVMKNGGAIHLLLKKKRPTAATTN